MPEDRRKGMMPKKVFSQSLYEIRKTGIRKVRLYSTGEPTLHPDFHDFMKQLYLNDMEVTVSTNGSTLDRCRDALLMASHVQLSISGWDKASYELLHPPLRFEETQRKVKEFFRYVAESDGLNQGHKTRVTINLLLTRKTDLRMFLNSWGEYVDKIRVSFLTGTTRYDGSCFITEQMAGLEEYLYPYRVDASRGCLYPFDVVSIAYDGRVVLCCEDFSVMLPFGVIDDGVMKCFHSPMMDEVRKGFLSGSLGVCSGCNRFNRPLLEDVVKIRWVIDGLSNPFKDKLELHV